MLAASLEATMNPTPKDVEAHRAAERRWQECGNQLADRADQVRLLEDALNEVRSKISKIAVGRGGERLAKAKAELEQRMRRNEATLASLVGDVLELSALQGGHPFVEHVADELVRHGNLDFVSLCRRAIGRANAIRSGTQKQA